MVSPAVWQGCRVIRLRVAASSSIAVVAALAAAGTVTPRPTTTTSDVSIIGTSVEGRPIEVTHADTGGDRRVLVIGVIHGDEPAGLAIVDDLSRLPVPAGVDLYLVDTMNPDGLAVDRRTNANGVDLNRNFPDDWGPIGQPGDWEYAGSGPASEPETQAIVSYVSALRPDLVIWYHQDAYSIAPGEGRAGAIRARYAELTGLPMASVTGGTYTGIAATWARHELESDDPPGVAFIVELGAKVTADDALMHANAVLTLASEDN